MCLLESWFSQGICPLVGFLGYMVVLFQVFKWMTPHPACDSAVVPCLHGFQAFLQSIPCGHIFSPVSSCHLSEVKSSPHPGIALQSLHSSSQPSHVLVDLRSCLGYVGSRPGLSKRKGEASRIFFYFAKLVFIVDKQNNDSFMIPDVSTLHTT